MGKFTLPSFGVGIIAILLVIVALAVDNLSFFEIEFFGTTTVVFGATGTKTYDDDDKLDDTDAYDCKDFEGSDDAEEDCESIVSRGGVWLAFNIIAILLGIAGAAASGAIKFKSLELPTVGMTAKFANIAAGVCVLIAVCVWGIGNPIEDLYKEVGLDVDVETGASIWIAVVGLVFFLIAGGLNFA